MKNSFQDYSVQNLNSNWDTVITPGQPSPEIAPYSPSPLATQGDITTFLSIIGLAILSKVILNTSSEK
ncbi:MAG: hypothetical protein QNJ36_15905 [Calothrix sp. MO_167.B42]|nr:hypothetical protein [Calothrix sp. MO_167.B42]